MWWLLIIVAFAIVVLLAVLLGFVPPPHTKTLIRIHNGQLRVTRGQVRAQAREFISDILNEAGVTNGYLAITYYNRAAFSRKIPRNVHQRLRNVLLNM